MPTYDTFGLLARFGRDVAGAAIVAEIPPGDRPGSIEPYSDHTLAEEVAGLDERPLAIYDDSELSLAGLQNKLLLVRTDEGWARPVAGRPSTHVLKVEDPRFPELIMMEAAALRLANAVGLSTISVEVERIAGIDCLIVSRFDRITREGDLQRVHQEDACQALGVNAEANRGKAKYQAHGGPSYRELARHLDAYARDPIAELRRLVAVLTFNTCIGNADAHGKNISLVHEAPGSITLAPLYDTVPTVMWPTLRRRPAMSVDKVADMERITAHDVAAEAARWPLDPAVGFDVARRTAQRMMAALEDCDLPDRLGAYIKQRSERFLAEPPAAA